ncbi:hypothetical protein PPSIR1_27318 [Plesiocystis pacifica SIR-1]|uniref:Lipoprotein n=1 Tax=Plesiocystis pacifica SIR-1 TaxID=391625 RepID=A6G4M8_9BACT|nr:ferritin-like domain-containing protein [Plesiocystis pacifica]EDM79148.1 hypothetical protein PPSIR1_27318 [Plesiocystis pacifica SIR-1]
MTTKLHAAYLSILFALGCSATPGSDDESSNEQGSDGNGETYACADPVPLMQTGDVPSGWVECADGFVHRAEAVECVVPAQTDDAQCLSGGETGGETEGETEGGQFVSNCMTAADCEEAPYGSCNYWFDDFSATEGCSCNYGCAADADCGPDAICVCAGVTGERSYCKPSECANSDSCGDGLCGLSDAPGICGGTAYHVGCVAPNAECHLDEDCEPGACDNGGATEPWECNVGTCEAPEWCQGACGRPLLVEGHARVASVAARTDWSVQSAPEPTALRRTLADYWTEVGLFEHASVASFARFALQLMALGAPPQLLAEARRATSDEIEHARLAFGLASAYLGRPVGPGPLPIHGALDAELDRFAIVDALIREACVEETLSALEAAEAASHAEDPEIAAALERIAKDELRHAQLGWRALRWMIDADGPNLRAFALARLDQAIDEARRSESARGLPASLRRHGVLDDELRAQLRTRALDTVLEPCVAALRGRASAAAAAS